MGTFDGWRDCLYTVSSVDDFGISPGFLAKQDANVLAVSRGKAFLSLTF